MRIFLAGASGAVGRRLVPLLVNGGHEVVATTRSRAKLEVLRRVGAEPIVMDALNSTAVREAVLAARPDAVVHQATALADLRNFKNYEAEFEMTNRLRTEGTENLLDAAKAAGARLFLAQSYAGLPNAREGGRVKSENDPLDSHPLPAMAKTVDAIRWLEDRVTGAVGLTGIVLRYGALYGPGTSLGHDGFLTEMVRRRRFPIFGDGAGVWSFVHIDDAAAATQLALERGAPGVYNIVDDEPAEVSIWLPELASILGAKPPFHLPAWLGRMLIGEAGMLLMTDLRGASNAKGKRALRWSPSYASWRDGFRHELASTARGQAA